MPCLPDADGGPTATLTLALDTVTAIMRETLIAAEFPDPTADLVARHLADAEAKGARSHGVMRLPAYVAAIESGALAPKATPEIVAETPPLIVVSGRGGIGIQAMDFALDRLIERTEAMPLAGAGVVNCGHTGRLGAYAERAAEAGRVVIIIGGGGRDKWPNVAPFGGTRGVISTNPYAFGIPAAPGDPLVCDFATSTISTGAVVLARRSGAALPEGCAIDRRGRPTSSPDAVLDGGSLLPAAGHKGSGLAIIAEALGSAVLGPAHEFNWLMIMVRADAVRSIEDVRRDACALVSDVRSTLPAQGVDRVLTPGEFERRNAQDARTGGVTLDQELWTEIVSVRRRLGLRLAG